MKWLKKLTSKKYRSESILNEELLEDERQAVQDLKFRIREDQEIRDLPLYGEKATPCDLIDTMFKATHTLSHAVVDQREYFIEEKKVTEEMYHKATESKLTNILQELFDSELNAVNTSNDIKIEVANLLEAYSHKDVDLFRKLASSLREEDYRVKQANLTGDFWSIRRESNSDSNSRILNEYMSNSIREEKIYEMTHPGPFIKTLVEAIVTNAKNGRTTPQHTIGKRTKGSIHQ